MKTAFLTASFLSALCFVSAMLVPDVDPHSGPKQWAAGVQIFVGCLGQLFFAAIAVALGLIKFSTYGAISRSLRKPSTWFGLLMLLPVAYTLVLFGILFIARY
jgi:hypothetical protein